MACQLPFPSLEGFNPYLHAQLVFLHDFDQILIVDS